MRSVGIIDPDRLAFIPPKYWLAHEFCFHTHDQIAALLVDYEVGGAHNWVGAIIERCLAKMAQSGETVPEEIDLLEVLKSGELEPFYRHHLVSHLVLGLTADMLHFLFEALSCFEKRKFAVGFSLIRKPLKENLLFLSWLLGDEAAFIARFEKDPHTTLNGMSPEERPPILAKAIAKLTVPEAFSAEKLNDIIFSKGHARSFEPVWQRASHLVTSQGMRLRTEDLSLNFIFHDAGSDELFDLLYLNLPYVMLYAVQVALECFSRVVRPNDLTASHLILCSMGCFETIFGARSKQGVTALLRRQLKPFLNCLHCEAPQRLTRSNAIGMYLREALTCSKCGLTSPFPLYWLLGQGKLDLVRSDDRISILEESSILSDDMLPD